MSIALAFLANLAIYFSPVSQKLPSIVTNVDSAFELSHFPKFRAQKDP